MAGVGALKFTASDLGILPYINVDTTNCIQKDKNVLKMGRTCTCKCTCTCTCTILHDVVI